MKKIKSFLVKFMIVVFMSAMPVTVTYLYATGDSLERATVWAFALFGQKSWTEKDFQALNNIGDLLGEIEGLKKQLEWTQAAEKEFRTKQAELIVWAHKNGKLETIVYVEKRFGGRIKKAATKYGVEDALITAVIATEWDKRNMASTKGAKGPMQLMPRTAKMLQVDPRHEFENILGGTRYLAQLQERFSSLELVIAAYNAGPTVVAKVGDIPPYKETIDYVNRVMLLYQIALVA